MATPLLIEETGCTESAGVITLSDTAQTGPFRGFDAANTAGDLADGEQVFIVIIDGNGDWALWRATYSLSGGTLTRVGSALQSSGALGVSGLTVSLIQPEPVEIEIAVSDETTDLTTGTAKATFRMPFAMTLTEVRASVTAAPAGSTLTVDINANGSTIMTTNKLTIDSGEKTSTTAATAAVITTASLSDDQEIGIDIDAVGSTTAGAGLKVKLIGYRS